MGGGGFGGGGGVEIDPSQFEEILSQFGGMPGMGGFSGGRSRSGRGRRPQTREPLRHDLPVPFETAVLGGTMSLSINDRAIDVKIPAGVEEGQTLRVQGQGPGGADLLLQIHIEAHPFFKREGNNLVIVAPISIAEAILGAKIDVPTLDGTKLTVKIPTGTSSGVACACAAKASRGAINLSRSRSSPRRPLMSAAER